MKGVDRIQFHGQNTDAGSWMKSNALLRSQEEQEVFEAAESGEKKKSEQDGARQQDRATQSAARRAFSGVADLRKTNADKGGSLGEKQRETMQLPKRASFVAAPFPEVYATVDKASLFEGVISGVKGAAEGAVSLHKRVKGSELYQSMEITFSNQLAPSQRRPIAALVEATDRLYPNGKQSLRDLLEGPTQDLKQGILNAAKAAKDGFKKIDPDTKAMLLKSMY